MLFHMFSCRDLLERVCMSGPGRLPQCLHGISQAVSLAPKLVRTRTTAFHTQTAKCSLDPQRCFRKVCWNCLRWNLHSSVLCASKEAIKQGKLIILEGNIGVGKTTLSQELSQRLLYKVVYEPTAKNPYLSLFYENPRKYALKLQHIIETGQGVILDRSVYSDRVFAVVNREDENICEQGFRFYEELRLQSLKVMPIPHVTIFLDASPEKCLERISSRGRGCESGIPLAYLKSLDTQYKNFLKEMKLLGSSVLSFNWDQYGHSDLVCEAVVAAPVSPWEASTVQGFRELVADPSAIAQALTIPWTFEDAILDEDGCDNAAEEAALRQEHAKPVRSASEVIA